MPERPDRIVVVGAGVLGLSCALRLLEAGHRVDVLARDLPLETTSCVAAAIWYPYLALPQDKVTTWGRAAYAEFARLSELGADGVTMRRGTELFLERTGDPWWRDAVPSLDRVPPRAPYVDGWSFVTPVVDMPRYLAWLSERVLDAGGTVTRMALARLPAAPLVVNCSGLGSRALADDILRRATALVPGVARARVLRHKVGLRPARPEVRLERVGDVIHCYGHGGAGVTLSWGCADEVTALVGDPA